MVMLGGMMLFDSCSSCLVSPGFVDLLSPSSVVGFGIFFYVWRLASFAVCFKYGHKERA
jgi:hypothetical protein